jgi:uncharacterized membrane protein
MKKIKDKKNVSIKILVSIVSLLLVITLLIVIKANINASNKTLAVSDNYSQETATVSEVSNAQDLKILKSDVTATPKFYSLNIDNTNMEVIALKASDGTIRTVFNTCQVCYISGRGYYKVEGNELVCQNCGNRFTFDQVEQLKGGCNPVPILAENKIDDGTNIVISKNYLVQAKEIFLNWK